ncbi:helitron_like_N domain-containing protein [Trichonephila clavipes]|nr:helitron_like_N domain-containing protein [Trichonephila clavipes]
MDFYAYYIMLRDHDFNLFLRTRQLFHQFSVDMNITVESERLRYIALNQKKLRAENYIHLQDAISADDYIRPNDIGKMVILPSTIVNSPSYQQGYIQGAFTYVRTLMEGLISS